MMNDYRMLIASSDPEYDRALSLWIRRKCPPMEVFCLDPDRWFKETQESFAGYDRILFGGSLKKIFSGPGVRAFRGFGEEKKTDSSPLEGPDPYRPAREVFRDLTSDPDADPRPWFGIRMIGLEAAGSDPLLEQAAGRILSALSRRIRVVIRADLREHPAEEPTVFRRDGCRNWDDFLYSAIYARYPDLLIDSPANGAMDEDGVVRFPRNPGPNPYLSLSEEELRKMYGRIRELCPADFFGAILPEPETQVYDATLRQMDLILVLYRESGFPKQRVEETIRRIKEKTDPSKRIMEVCVSDRFEEEDTPGFILHLSDPAEPPGRFVKDPAGMPEDLERLAEFIDDGCFI